MQLSYKKTLKTGFPNGNRIIVRRTQTKDYVLIDTDREFDFLKSKPDHDKRSILNKVTFNFRSGQFHIKCDYDQYPKVIIAFTKYLEDVVFAAMLETEKRGKKNDNSNSGNSGNDNTGGAKGGNTTGNDGGNKKKGLKSAISSVFTGPGRDEPPEGNGEG